MAFGREVVEDGDAFGLLLQGEVAHVGDEDDELFLVVRAAEGLGGGFNDDDAGVCGSLFGERAGAVGVAVVGDVDPAAGFQIFLGWEGGGDLRGEGGHAEGGMLGGVEGLDGAGLNG